MEINKLIKERTTEDEEEISQMSQTQAMTAVWGNESTELADLLEDHPTTIQIAANIGLGKSTTTNIIGKFGGSKTLFEDLENPVLSLYYDDKATYTERLQLDVINQRLYSILLAKGDYPNQSLIFDRTPYEDPLVFIPSLTEEGHMTKEKHDYCQKYFQMKKQQIENNSRKKLGKKGLDPDLIIILQASEENGWKRVLAREREMEVREDADKGKGLTREFYHSLHTKYENFANALREHYTGPILTLNQDSPELGDSTNTKGQLYTVKSVKEALKIIYKPE